MSNYDEERHAEINDALDRVTRCLQDMQQQLLRSMREDDYEVYESHARMSGERAIAIIESIMP